MNSTKTMIGIDISSDKLDIWDSRTSKHMVIGNNEKDIADFVTTLPQDNSVSVAMEATSGLQKRLILALNAKGLAFFELNPRSVATYRKLRGKFAKTDMIDAKLIADYAAEYSTKASNISDFDIRFRELFTAREQVSDMIAITKKRLKRLVTERAIASIHRQIDSLKQEIALLDKELHLMIKGNAAKFAIFEQLAEIDGIGKITAMAILAYMPEIGTMTAKQAASLSGLAPVTRESGKMKFRQAIYGGRKMLRKKLYMSAFNAIKHNEEIKNFFERLIKNHKPYKVAITAAMRKIIIFANAAIKEFLTEKTQKIAA